MRKLAKAGHFSEVLQTPSLLRNAHQSGILQVARTYGFTLGFLEGHRAPRIERSQTPAATAANLAASEPFSECTLSPEVPSARAAKMEM
jgi:hypothetical protein